MAYAAAAAAARAAVGGDGAAAADAVVNLIYAAWGRAHGPLWRLGRDFAESEVVPFIRADFDRVTAAVRAGGWSDDTPVSADLFGDLWPDNVFATWSVLTDATERLAALVGRHADQVRVIWTRGGDRVGGGGLTVSVSVPAWGVEKSRAIRWGDLGDAHQLRASLFSLWDDVLKERIKAVQATGT